MCSDCRQLWTALQILWSTVYVICGAAQLIAGIFFLISTPTFHLNCNIWTGGWNVVMGIVGGMLSCLGHFSSRRQEFLLYIAVSILVVNCVNVILSEWGLYFTDTTQLLKQHPNHTLIDYACFATRVATATVIIVSFVDSQFAFCSMQIKSSLRRTRRTDKKTTTTTIKNTNSTLTNKKKKKLHDSHEQVSDIEYIIPRPKSSKTHTPVYYSQSWVFDADSATSSNNNIDTSYLKILENGTVNPKITHNGDCIINENNIQTHLIDNPVVHIEEASSTSDDNNSNNSDRKLCHMRSFSRSASPILLSSASSSNINLNQTTNNNPPIYECLETIYRTRLNTGDVNSGDLIKEEIHYQAPQTMVMRRVDPVVNSNVEKVQYASLMKELQRAINNKKDINLISPQSDSTTISDKTQTDSKSSSSSSHHESSPHSDCKSSSDTEFSKELEAALQLIQDLESPNTIDTTPSNEQKCSFVDGCCKEQRPLSIWHNSDASESEKTLSAVGSFTEITSPLNECHQPDLYPYKSTNTTNGKNSSVIICYPKSQSTSGYSSPTNVSNGETPCWSTTSSLNGSNNDILTKPLSYSIHNAKSTTVISLYSPCDDGPQINKTKSITLVNITGDNNNTSTLPKQHQLPNNNNSNNNTNISKSNISNEIKTTPKSTIIATTTTTPPPPIDSNNKGGNQSIIWKSLLRKKKQSPVPKLCPELEGAIIKSESLAYLSELELLARHQRNKEIQREIEERVIQQLGTPRTESNC